MRKLRRKNYSSSLIRARIIKGMESYGCPLCNIIHDGEKKYLAHVIYEMVNNPFYRKKLRQSGGYCTYHSWLLVNLIESNVIPEKLGASIIVKDLLEEYLARMDEEGFSNRGEKNPCPLCEEASSLEKAYIMEVVSWIYMGCDEFLEKYRNSKSVLCHKHFMEIRKKVKDRNCREKLIEIQENKVKRILEMVKSYIEKKRYDSGKQITVEESESYRVAIEILKGGKALIARCNI